jgi:hypothetical protein
MRSRIGFSLSFFAAVFLNLVFVIPVGFAEDRAGTGTTNPEGRFWKESGFVVGYGTNEIPEGHYEPILLIWHLAYDLRNYIPALKNHKGILAGVCEPQVNLAFQPSSEFEFGVGLGLKYLYPLTDRLYPYVQLTVGPHYISLQTKEQASGFIFSNTIGAGLYYFVTENSAVMVGYRARHISNAGTREPNDGINTHFGTIGYSFFF